MSHTNPAVEALKPCPFCGSHDVDTWNDTVFCKRCGGTTSDHESIGKAAEAWNRRAQADQTPVAGRVISEGLLETVLEWLENAQAEEVQRSEERDPQTDSLMEALRAAPTAADASTAEPSETVRREGE